MGAYDASFQFIKSLALPFKTMLVSAPGSTTESLGYGLYTDNSGNTSLTESASRSTNVVTQSSVNFDRIFGKHKINAIAVAETRNSFGNALGATGYGLNFINLDELSKITNKTGSGTEKIPTISGSSSQSRVIGFVGRVNYEFNDKYLAEVSVRRDGSYLFSGMNGSRWINFPAVSLGWRINNESWFNADWVDNLKVRGGIGKTATSAVNAYQFLDLMGVSTSQVILGGASQSIVYASTLGNPNLHWAKCLTYNFGTDFSACSSGNNDTDYEFPDGPAKNSEKPRFIWIDAAANFKDFANSKENIARDLTLAKNAGFTDIVVDIRPTTGDILYKSSVSGVQQVEWLGAWFRQCQLELMNEVPNVGMVTTTDAGSEKFIHPPYKIKVGERLAYWALAKTYGIKGISYSGPIYKS